MHLILILDIYLIQGDDDLNLIINREFNELYGVLSTFKIISNYKYFKIQAEEVRHIIFINLTNLFQR